MDSQSEQMCSLNLRRFKWRIADMLYILKALTGSPIYALVTAAVEYWLMNGLPEDLRQKLQEQLDFRNGLAR